MTVTEAIDALIYISIDKRGGDGELRVVVEGCPGDAKIDRIELDGNGHAYIHLEN